MRNVFAAPAFATELGGNYLGVVQNQRIAGPEEAREIAHKPILKRLFRLHHE
jgi:hypothetical protein